jgi:ADP-ribosylglycohydrolase
MNNTDIYKKTYGALAGVAYGDSMGMPAEFWTPKMIKKHFGKITGFLPAPAENEISNGLKAGEVTDDTYMTLIFSEAIIESGGIPDPKKLVEKILNWADENKLKVKNLFGPSTKKALESISHGAPVEEAGRFGTTNGGAMRIVPAGIISEWRDLNALTGNVRLMCLATHNTNHAIAAASAIAAAVSYAIYGDGNLETLIQVSKQAAEKGMELGYTSIGASIARRIDVGIDIARNEKEDDKMLSEIYNVIGTGLPSNESIPAAIALAYRAKGNPLACARLTANIGGDTDTIGAMACAICGALSGVDIFSEDDLKLLSVTNGIDFARLAEELMKCSSVR